MIPFVDLSAQHCALRAELHAALESVFSNTTFVLGPAVARFETAFAALVGTRHALGVNSGTSALHLALLAAGVGPGDEVMVPAMTFVATLAAVRYTGARPVVVDIDPADCTIDPAQAAARVTARTRAIIPVHLYGLVAEMSPIVDLARRHNLVVIEDAAQAHGAEYQGRCSGALGDIGCFSFYPTKNLGACGEAGAITTDRDDWAATLRSLRDCGRSAPSIHAALGYNYRMDGIQGAVLDVKLRHLARWNARRREIARRYDELLAGAPGLVTPTAREPGRHVYHCYSLRVPNRDRVAQRMLAAGVQTRVYYPVPMHLQPCLADLGYRAGDFPVAERLAQEQLALPIYPELTDEQVEQVAAAVKAACA